MVKVQIQTFITTEIDTDTGNSRIIKQFSRPLKEFQYDKPKVSVPLTSSPTEEEYFQ